MSKKKSKAKKSVPNQPHAEPAHTSDGGDVAVAVAPEEGAAAAVESQPEAAEGTLATAAPTSVEDEGAVNKPKSGSKKKKVKSANAATVGDVAKGYLEQLEQRAASASTLFSYELELMSAMEELGAEKPIASLTKKQVETFFESPRVMRTKKGSEKSPLSIAKTRRVFRQALVWAVGAGLIEEAPLPDAARKE